MYLEIKPEDWHKVSPLFFDAKGMHVPEVLAVHTAWGCNFYVYDKNIELLAGLCRDAGVEVNVVRKPSL